MRAKAAEYSPNRTFLGVKKEKTAVNLLLPTEDMASLVQEAKDNLRTLSAQVAFIVHEHFKETK